MTFPTDPRNPQALTRAGQPLEGDVLAFDLAAPDPDPVTVIKHLNQRPYPRHMNPAHRHLRNQDSPYSVKSKRSMLNFVARAIGAATPPKLESPDGDKRKTHPEQLYSYDFVAWHEITASSFSEIMAIVRDAGKSTSTRAAMRALLRGVATEAWRMGYIDNEEMERIKSIKEARGEKKRRGKAQSLEVMSALFAAVDRRDTAHAHRDGVMLSMLAALGLRRVELVRIRMEHIDFSDWTITISGKGNKERLLQIPAAIRPRLLTYLDRFRSHQPGYLFNPIWSKQARVSENSLEKPWSVASINMRIEKIVKEANQEIEDGKRTAIGIKISPHDLRRTFATWLLNRGLEVRAIQILLGHASMATTETYLFDKSDGYRQAAAGLLDDDMFHREK